MQPSCIWLRLENEDENELYYFNNDLKLREQKNFKYQILDIYNENLFLYQDGNLELHNKHDGILWTLDTTSEPKITKISNKHHLILW